MHVTLSAILSWNVTISLCINPIFLFSTFPSSPFYLLLNIYLSVVSIGLCSLSTTPAASMPGHAAIVIRHFVVLCFCKCAGRLLSNLIPSPRCCIKSGIYSWCSCYMVTSLSLWSWSWWCGSNWFAVMTDSIIHCSNCGLRVREQLIELVWVCVAPINHRFNMWFQLQYFGSP